MAGKSALQKAVEDLTMVEYTTVPELATARITITMKDPGSDSGSGDRDVEFGMEDAIRMRDRLTQAKEQAERDLKQINDQLLLLMRAGQIDKVKLWDGMKLEVRNGSSPSKLEATKLLEQGVPLETIQNATVPGTPYQFVMVVKPKKVD